MFGFRKTIPASEFGLWVLKYADEFITNDALRSLASRFPAGYDASRGWTPVFESNGVPIPTVKLYRRQYTHCILQSVFKGHSPSLRRAMVQGAISGLQDTPAGYDFKKTFDNLESVFEGNYKFDSRVEPLNDDGRQNFLTPPTVHIMASKYLIDSFVLHHMKNSNTFVENFKNYTGTIGSSLATAHKAMNAIASKAKIGSEPAH